MSEGYLTGDSVKVKSDILRKLGLSFNGVRNKQLASFIAGRHGWPKPQKNKQYEPYFRRYYSEVLKNNDAVKAESEAAVVFGFSPSKAGPRYSAAAHGFTAEAWRTVRYKALVLHGARCQCCGATAQSSGKPLHVDHIKPKSRYPELCLDINNLQVLCEDCNFGKGYWDESDWRPLSAERTELH